MKQPRKVIYSAILSLGIITSSLTPAFAENSNALETTTQLSDQVYDDSNFISGVLTQKNSDPPENIVDRFYEKNSKKVSGKTSKTHGDLKKFKNSMGRTVISTYQTFNGIRVYGTDQKFHINNDGVIECIVGKSIDAIEEKLVTTNVPSTKSQNTVLNEVEKQLGIKNKYSEDPVIELILYPASDGKYQYVYEVKLKTKVPSYSNFTYYVDAESLSIIKTVDNLLDAEQPIVGSGIGQFGTTIPNLQMSVDTSTYYLHNLVDNIETCDMSTHLRYSEPDSFFDSGTASNHQKDAVDAHNNITKVMQFFKGAPFYRNGNDGNGSLMTLDIRTTYQLNALGDTNYICFYTGTTSSSGAQSQRSVSCALDVCAHEFTHGILYYGGLSSNSGEAGALHEGISDVFGIITENNLQNKTDWTMAEDTGYVMRDCANPRIGNYIDYLNSDREVHTGAGVITKAANLITLGGTYRGQTVTGIGYSKLANIFYKAINDGYLVSDMTFLQFANAVLQSAKLAYGSSSQEVQTVNNAFIAVGVFSGAPTNFMLTYKSGTNIQFQWDSAIGAAKYGVYRKFTGSYLSPSKVAESTTNAISLTSPVGSYDYYVAVLDSSGNRITDFSNSITIIITYLSAPTNFVLASRSNSNLQFSWTSAPGVYRYGLYSRSTGSGSVPTQVGESYSTTLSYNITPGSFDFCIAGLDSSGNIITEFSAYVTVIGYNPAPTNFYMSSRSGSTAWFNWTTGQGTRYAIYRKPTYSTGSPAKVTTSSSSPVIVMLLRGTYDYCVAAIDSSGNRLSDYSNSVTVTY